MPNHGPRITTPEQWRERSERMRRAHANRRAKLAADFELAAAEDARRSAAGVQAARTAAARRAMAASFHGTGAFLTEHPMAAAIHNLGRAIGELRGCRSRERSMAKRLDRLGRPDAELEASLAAAQAASAAAHDAITAARIALAEAKAADPESAGRFSPGGETPEAREQRIADERRVAEVLREWNRPAGRPADNKVCKPTAPLPRDMTRARSAYGFASPLLARSYSADPTR